MKNEDRIVELLAESLKRLDQQENILNQHAKILNELIQSQKELVQSQKELAQSQKELIGGQLKLVQVQEQLIDKFHKMNNYLLTKQEKIKNKIIRLKDENFKN
ncbi:MAG: hypothetical protein AAF600_06945 [Bacteroidota bacterium]